MDERELSVLDEWLEWEYRKRDATRMDRYHGQLWMFQRPYWPHTISRMSMATEYGYEVARLSIRDVEAADVGVERLNLWLSATACRGETTWCQKADALEVRDFFVRRVLGFPEHLPALKRRGGSFDVSSTATRGEGSPGGGELPNRFNAL
jgi:hypothetical protein